MPHITGFTFWGFIEEILPPRMSSRSWSVKAGVFENSYIMVYLVRLHMGKGIKWIHAQLGLTWLDFVLQEKCTFED